MLLELLGMGTKLVGAGISDAKSKKENALYRQQAQSQFDQQMDFSVQRRVKDAKAAGIHPLFAMGASVGASPTLSAGGSSRAGNAMGRAMQSIGQSLGLVARNKAAATRDIAEAMLLDSERVRIEQDAISQGRDDPGAMGPPVPKPYAYSGEQTQMGPAAYYAPEVPLSKRPGVKAGTAPAKQELLMPDGRKIELFSEDAQADEINQIEIVRQRAIHYATDAMAWASKNLSDRAIIGALKSVGRKRGLSDQQLGNELRKAFSRARRANTFRLPSQPPR